jgi:hypothetical protein
LRGRGNDKEEAKKRHSEAARLHGSRRFTKYGISPPPGLNKWEARAKASPSAALHICVGGFPAL